MMSRRGHLLLSAAVLLLVAACATPGPDAWFRQTALSHGAQAAVLRGVPDLARMPGLQEGAAPLANLANYWGKPLLLRTAAEAIQKARATLPAEEALVQVAEQMGLWSMSMYGTSAVLMERIRHGAPVIVFLQDWTNIDSRRFSVVVGFDEVTRQFLCHDGVGSPVVYSFDEFARKWLPVRHWMAVLAPPEGARWPLTANELQSRARFHEKRGNWAESLKDFEAATRLKPADLEVQMGLAHALQQMGDLDRAIALYRRLLQQNPKSVRIANNLAFVLAKSRTSLGEAESLARSAVQNEPTNPAALDTLGYVLLERKQFAEAIPVLESAYEHAQGLDAHSQHEIAVHLALAYLGDRRVQMMQKIVNDILESEPDFSLPAELKK